MIPTSEAHLLYGALSVLLPDARKTLLLRACVASDRSGGEALEAWLALQSGSIRESTGRPRKWLLPLLHEAVRNHAVKVDPGMLTILKTAALREELRTRSFREICKRVLSALAGSGHRPILLKGAALAETVYPDPALRHSHDIEILMPDADLLEVGRSLEPLGFSASGCEATEPDSLELVHASGLPLVLRRELFEVPFYNAIAGEVCARAELTDLLGTRVRVLSPADALLHGCGLALHSPGRESQRWIIDAWFIIEKQRRLDWDALLRTAARAHLRLPLAALLTFLAHDLSAAIPPDVLTDAAASAAAADPLDGELALFAARSMDGVGFRTLIRRERSIAGRLRILRWMLLPSRAYLTWATQKPDTWRLPMQYVARPVRYLMRRTRS